MRRATLPPTMKALNSPRPLVVQAALLTTMVLWGVSFVASRVVLDRLTPLTYMGIRFAIAGGLLALVMAVRGRPRFSLRTHALIALTALAEPVAYFLFESYGLRIVGATITALIIATIPLVVMLLAALILKEPMRPSGLVAFLVSAVGIILLVVGGRTEGFATSVTVTWSGIVLVLGAVLSASFYITLARGLTQEHDPVNLTIVQTWWGAGVFAVLWASQDVALRDVTVLDRTGWFALAFLAGGATIAAFMLYNWALRHETAGTASLYINAIPVITAITSWLYLGERLSPLQIGGAVLVLAAVRVSTRPTAQSRGAMTPEAVATTVPPEA